ncbi:MAG: galactose mutarotase [Prevotellaceae bacterium]|nr:galactose mutarotase [Candidatus Colivivens caballi]
MKTFKSILAASATAAILCACGSQKSSDEIALTVSGLNPADFDTTYVDSLKGEKEVALFTLKNANGMEVCITNFGGRIVSIAVPDKDGNMQDVVLGFDKAADYFPQNNASDFGAAIGRYANRINQGQITVNGETIQLPQNNFGHCLHGGPSGWQYQVYDVVESKDDELTLQMVSPDGDNNFPGEVTATVNYYLNAANGLEIRYSATTDKTTVINMTNHSYFNLNGDPKQPITNHIVTINADGYTPVDTTYMTTGEIATVEGTPMDFRAGKEVGKDIDNFDFEQIKNGNGFDHNWVLNTAGNIDAPAVTAVSPVTGIKLEVFTTEPGIQVYSGNFLDGTVTGKKGIVYQQRTGICFESQKYPDSPNKAWEESNAWLNPGEEYSSYCMFKFSVEK